MDYFYSHACWIIIDCWEHQPLEDVEIVPNINEINYKVADKISNAMIRIKHCVVSCNAPVMPQFKNLINVKGDQQMLLDYMKMFNLKFLVYLSFLY
jgi:hypothetical protein